MIRAKIKPNRKIWIADKEVALEQVGEDVFRYFGNYRRDSEKGVQVWGNYYFRREDFEVVE